MSSRSQAIAVGQPNPAPALPPQYDQLLPKRRILRLKPRQHAGNFMMHLLVADVEAWWHHVEESQLAAKYDVRAEPPDDRPWGMRDFTIVDPTGVLWRIAQNT